MDCLKRLVLLAVAALACPGCVMHQNLLTYFGGTKTAKRLPKASTEVAYAKFQEGEARSKNLAPVSRERKLDASRIAYQRALEIDPNDIEAALGLGRVYAALNDHQRTIAAYRKYTKLHPNEPRLWLELGIYHGKRREYDPAVTCLKKAVKLDPENRVCVKALGVYLAAAGRVEESLNQLRPMFGEAKAHLNLARTLVRLQRPEFARVQMQLAFRKDPSLAESREGKMLVAGLRGDAPEAAAAQEGPVANISFQLGKTDP